MAKPIKKYVRRKDNPMIVTGQSGFSDFKDQFDPLIYEQVEGLPPEGVIRERSLLERSKEAFQELTVSFLSTYTTEMKALPVDTRKNLVDLMGKVEKALLTLGDIELAKSYIEDFKSPPGFGPKLDPIKIAMKARLDNV